MFASGLLRYNAQSSGINNMELDLSINVMPWATDGVTTYPSSLAGSWMLDAAVGNIHFGTRERNGSPKELDAQLRLKAGYFLNNRILLEGGVSLFTNNASFSGDIGSFSSSFLNLSVSGGARYFLQKDRRFLPYVMIGALFEFDDVEVESSNPRFTPVFQSSFNREIKELYLQAGLGGLYFLNPNVALDLQVNYRKEVNAGNDNIPGGSLGIQVLPFRK